MPSPRPPANRKKTASLARRAAPAVVLTAGGLALLLQLDRPSTLDTGSDQLALGLTSSAASTAPAAPAPTQAPAAGPPATQPPATRAPATTAPAPRPAPGQAQPPAPTTTPPPATTAPAAGTGACLADVVQGPVVQTRWGPVQVAARLTADGLLCAVDAIQTPYDERKSVAINSYAVPRLNAAALRAGADFDAVSGATVTSEGYRRSLQAILDAG